ncbi:UNVERIFIED_CONTAM: hypothetical protein GTU68_039050 [Idotea baltica]|nr:hypothetical protein [Idotea baltica]
MFFVVVYLHMFRGIIYGSHREPRELVWLIGCVIFVALMAESFMGYLLPWGNMSYWGAQVIISLFDVIPYVGAGLTEWIRGDFVISDATLNRFFAFHVIMMPLILVVLVFLHLIALHQVGSNNPDGIDIYDHVDERPYYTVKDLVGVCGFLIVYLGIVFFVPDLGGIFLEKDNFAPANPLQTPPDIVPLWYFTPFYSILRNSSGKAWGVILMGGAIVMFFLLPWLDRSPVFSIRYRSWPFKVALALFVVAFLILGYLGMHAPTPLGTLMAQICTVIYFAFFVLMPWFTSIGKTKPVPDRVTFDKH